MRFFRLFVEGVADDRVEVRLGGVRLTPVRNEFGDANESARCWFRKDGEAVVMFK
jgi:hypothetical protein